MVGVVEKGLTTWMTLIRNHLEKNVLLEDSLEAKRIWYRATLFSIVGRELYIRGFSKTQQRCVEPLEAEKILKSIHSGVYGNHTKFGP